MILRNDCCPIITNALNQKNITITNIRPQNQLSAIKRTLSIFIGQNYTLLKRILFIFKKNLKPASRFSINLSNFNRKERMIIYEFLDMLSELLYIHHYTKHTKNLVIQTAANTKLITSLTKKVAWSLNYLFMLGISIVFPTLTMYHGTNFNYAGTKIAQTGKWKIGEGNYAGTGLYFGINKGVAEYYSSAINEGILVVRVTLSFIKNLNTLKKAHRSLLGFKGGEKLSRNLKAPWVTIEHWRERNTREGWWEYCIVQPDKMGEYVSTWRIRPVAILRDNKITRLWGGSSAFSTKPGNLIMVLAAGLFSFFYQLTIIIQ